jgi:hypothetical protein
MDMDEIDELNPHHEVRGGDKKGFRQEKEVIKQLQRHNEVSFDA